MRRRPEPQALDPASGFKVPHRNLVRQWDGEYIDRRFVDKRNPQDYVKARSEQPQITNPRPEPADTFVDDFILWEDGLTVMKPENGIPIISEASVARTLP